MWDHLSIETFENFKRYERAVELEDEILADHHADYDVDGLLDEYARLRTEGYGPWDKL